MPDRPVARAEQSRVRARLQQRGSRISPVDPQVDHQWAQDYDPTNTYKPYWDYFFTGADVEIKIAELDGDDDHELTPLPIQRFNFSVQQQKRPVFGYASYSYDGMLRGNRVIQGQFTLATRYPDFMQKALAKAASNRVERQGELANPYASFRGLTEDDANIDRYWGRNLDPVVPASGRNEWSIHPPFNFLIVYGHEGTYQAPLDNMFDPFGSNNAMFTDYNQRLVDAPFDNESNKLMIEACELQTCNRAYEPQADLLVELYQFIARDVLIPRSSRGRSNTPHASSGPG